MKQRYSKRFYSVTGSIICCCISLSFLFRAIAPEAAKSHHDVYVSRQLNSDSGRQPLVMVQNSPEPTAHFFAEEFYFETGIDSPSITLANPTQYTDQVSHHNGALDILSKKQGNTITYIFQVSSIAFDPCEPDPARACQSNAASAQGNVAEIQITLPGHTLRPGAYTLAINESMQANSATIYSRKLYSDPSHGQLGCQVWGEGTLNIQNVNYSANGNLEHLEVTIVQECVQTTPMPAVLPQDSSLNVAVEPIERYTFRASWRCLSLTPKAGA